MPQKSCCFFLFALLGLGLFSGCKEGLPPEGEALLNCGACDTFSSEENPLALVVVLSLDPSWDPDLAAAALKGRILGKRTWTAFPIDGSLDLDVGPGQVAYLFAISQSEAERLSQDQTAFDEFWTARLHRLTAAMELDPWVVAAAPFVEGQLLERPTPEVGPCPPTEPDDQLEPGCLHIDDPDWHLRSHPAAAHVFDAWELLRSRDRGPGEGALIAHIDTGYLPSPELGHVRESLNVITREQRQGFDGQDQRHGTLLSALDGFGHGLATAAILISPPGIQFDANTPELVRFVHRGVTGVAPQADLLPIRWSQTVVVGRTNAPQLVRAIAAAVDAGADVASISAGGKTRSQRTVVEQAVREATEQGLIIVAAAGNASGPVFGIAEPALMPQAIAVTAANFWGGPWRGGLFSGSNYGSAADVGAPSQDVHIARVALVSNNDGGWVYDTQAQGIGTSLSTPIVAGTAALWVSYHTRQHLRETYCRDTDDDRLSCSAITAAFLYSVLSEEGHSPWDASRIPSGRYYGVGLINAAGVLAAPLPTFADLCATASSYPDDNSDLVRRFELAPFCDDTAR